MSEPNPVRYPGAIHFECIRSGTTMKSGGETLFARSDLAVLRTCVGPKDMVGMLSPVLTT